MIAMHKRFFHAVRRFAGWGGVAVGLLAAGAFGQQTPERSYEYPAELVAAFQTLPVQDGGRVKPIDTLAGFQLLKFNGKRTLGTEGFAVEDRMGPAVWMLDCFLFPEQAKRYECFIVQDEAVTQAVGLAIEGKKKRDRYSYNELAAVKETLTSRAALAFRKNAKERNRLERQVLILWNNFVEFEDLTRVGSFAGNALPTSSIPWISALYGGQDVELPIFLSKAQAFMDSRSSPDDDPKWRAFQEHYAEIVGRHNAGMGMIPPVESAQEAPAWLAWPEISSRALSGETAMAQHLPVLESLGRFVSAKGDPAQLTERFQEFHTLITERASARGEYAMVPAEVKFYQYDFFYRALYCFVAGFLLVAISWLGARTDERGLPKGGRWWVRASWVFTSFGTLLLVAGITYRCVLRSRPPISTLYETILFIAAVIVLIALFMEWFTRRRIALAVGAFLGALGMFIAGKYELREAATAGDTMPALQAVLDTNFWLATHVTTINMGYAAGLLCAGLGHVWLLLHFLGKKAASVEVHRMMYGVLLFSLLFSVVGTILGGVWANDSWGRFWGWDPKENGALLICIWELMILHARMGGFIRPFGFALMNIALGMVVATSWWGVNLLGVGLHSYGFTEGVGFWLMVFYGLELGIMLIAWIAHLIKNTPQAPSQPSSEASAS